MPPPRILVLAGSTSAASPAGQLAAAFARELAFLDAEVTRISLADHVLPLADADDHPATLPPAVQRLRALFRNHDAAFIATPERAGSLPALLKNLLEWLEPQDEEIGARPAPLFAIASIAPAAGGGRVALDHLRNVLATSFDGFVIGALSIEDGGRAFDDKGRLDDPRHSATMQALARELVHASRRLSPGSG